MTMSVSGPRKPRRGGRGRRVARTRCPESPSSPAVRYPAPTRESHAAQRSQASVAVPEERLRVDRVTERDGDTAVHTARAQALEDVVGHALLALKSEWMDGTTHLLFEPIEFRPPRCIDG